MGNKSLNTDFETVKALTNLLSETMVVIGCEKAAILQSAVNKSPVRYYYYSYRANQSLTDVFLRDGADYGKI